jgi:poly [ADP-ribose] polymerase
VSIDWYLTSIEKEAKQPESEYAVDASAAPQPSGVKRTADTAASDSKDDEEPEPAAKKSKAIDGTSRPKRGAKKAPEPDKDQEEEEEEEEVKLKKTTLVKGKGKAKAKKNVKEEEDKEEEEEEEEEKPVMKTIVKKGKAPVDEISGLQSEPLSIMGEFICS